VNIQEYISGGIIESYVLGLASPEERSEFERLSAQHPELLQARIAFEIALEKQAINNAIEPPAALKEKLLNKIATGVQTFTSTPAPVIKMKTTTGNWLKYAVAACFILLAGSLFWNLSLYNKNKKLKEAYNNSIARINDMNKDMHVMIDPGIKMAVMKGMPVSPGSYATIYWDTTSHDVYLLANNLPVPASDKQYQLWAIFNGKPVDLGVFDIKKEKLLIQAKNAQGAEAFAITLEKKGGSPAPTMDSLYVMGKL